MTAATLLIALGFCFGRAGAFETFTLDGPDKIIAESPSCSAECVVAGASRRSCTVRAHDCRVVCQQLADCSVNGERPMKVCAVISTR
jgi:hypothetical protein